MMAQIEVERVADGTLSRKVWRFLVIVGYGAGPVTLRVEFYGEETRASKRHKWVSTPKERYTASDPRRYNSGIDAKSVPLPEDIIAEAKSELMKLVEVTGPLIRDGR